MPTTEPITHEDAARAATTVHLPMPATDDVLDEVTNALNGLARTSAFEFARVAGNLIVERFYGGDFSAWRTRGVKDASFRKLAERAEMGELQVSAPDALSVGCDLRARAAPRCFHVETPDREPPAHRVRSARGKAAEALDLRRCEGLDR